MRPYAALAAFAMLVALVVLGFGTVETHVIALLAGFTMALVVTFPRPEESKPMCHVVQAYAAIITALSALQYHLLLHEAVLMFIEIELVYAILMYIFTLAAKARQMHS